MTFRNVVRAIRVVAAVTLVCGLTVCGPVTSASAAGAPAAPRAVEAARLVAVQPSHAGTKVYSSVTHRSDVADSHYCNGCTPPLVYSGGPVADTSGGGLTITPIYWDPTNAVQFPAGYEDLINQYVRDIAAGSGDDKSVYSVDAQYYSQAGDGTKTYLKNAFQAGTPIVDTQPYPASGCTPDTGFSVCLTDAQLTTELQRLQAADHLPVGLGNFYPVFFTGDVETFDSPTSSSASAYCGYHSVIGNGSDDSQNMFYGNEVFEADGCGEGSSPNNDIPADSSISTLSHEISEFMTDPDASQNGWATKDGSSEIGDICGDDYGAALGSTDPSNPQTTEYNQDINGHFYYTQEEFSNAAYASQGTGFGCQQNYSGGGASPSSSTTAPASTAATPSTAAGSPTTTGSGSNSSAGSSDQLFIDATPNAIDADGSTTSEIDFYVTDQDGNVIPNDKVTFSEYIESGSGECGTMKNKSATTDDNGSITDNYTASKSNAVCAVVAKDSQAGKSATVDVYQGTTQAQAPTANDNYPQSMVSGQQITFDNAFKNNGTQAIDDPTFDITIYSGDKTKTNVDSSQVTLLYSLTGASGKFAPIPLTGSTVKDGGISTNWTPPVQPSIAPGATLTVTYELTLAPHSAAGIVDNDLISLEGVLEQENLAAGTTTTLADTYASDVNVSDSGSSSQASGSSGSNSSSSTADLIVGLAVIVVILALIVLAVVLIVRRSRRPRMPS